MFKSQVWTSGQWGSDIKHLGSGIVNMPELVIEVGFGYGVFVQVSNLSEPELIWTEFLPMLLVKILLVH